MSNHTVVRKAKGSKTRRSGYRRKIQEQSTRSATGHRKCVRMPRHGHQEGLASGLGWKEEYILPRWRGGRPLQAERRRVHKRSVKGPVVSGGRRSLGGDSEALPQGVCCACTRIGEQ